MAARSLGTRALGLVSPQKRLRRAGSVRGQSGTASPQGRTRRGETPSTALATAPARRRAAATRPRRGGAPCPRRRKGRRPRVLPPLPSQARPCHARVPGEVDCSLLVIASPAVSLAKIASIAARCGSDRHRPRFMRRNSHCRRYGYRMSHLLGRAAAPHRGGPYRAARPSPAASRQRRDSTATDIAARPAATATAPVGTLFAIVPGVAVAATRRGSPTGDDRPDTDDGRYPGHKRTPGRRRSRPVLRR